MVYNKTLVFQFNPISTIDKVFFYDFKHIQAFQNLNKSPESFPTDISQKENTNQVCKAFLPLIRIMQFLGCTPTVVTRDKNGGIKFEYKILSIVFIYSYFCLISSAIFTTFYILNREFAIDFPVQVFLRANYSDTFFRDPEVHIPDWMEKGNRAFQLMVPIFSIFNLLIVRLRVPPLIKFINNWTEILQQFEDNFNQYYHIRLVGLHRVEKVTIPVLAFLYIGPLVKMGWSNFQILVTDSWFLNFYFKACMGIFISSAMMLSTFVTLLSLFTILIIARQIRIAINCEFENMKSCVTVEQIKGWTMLISRLRDQITVLEGFFSLPELNDLLFTFINVLGTSYVAISLLLENLSSTADSMIPFALMYLGTAIFRTYCKGHLAEMIAEEEYKIGIDVVSMHVKNENDNDAFKARFEMKNLCNMIFSTPIQISFSKIIVLNKKLLLVITSQLASYLVVFLQFKRSPF